MSSYSFTGTEVNRGLGEGEDWDVSRRVHGVPNVLENARDSTKIVRQGPMISDICVRVSENPDSLPTYLNYILVGYP